VDLSEIVWICSQFLNICVTLVNDFVSVSVSVGFLNIYFGFSDYFDFFFEFKFSFGQF